MLKSESIVAFVGTSNPKRARAFYQDVLGLDLLSEDAFALVFDAAGIMLRVAIVPEVRAAQYTVLGWDVADIAAEVKALTDKGVTFQRYPGMKQDKLGIWKSPAAAQVAWFQDPDGNTLSLTQFPKQV